MYEYPAEIHATPDGYIYVVDNGNERLSRVKAF
jgi:hypothetical protein